MSDTAREAVRRLVERYASGQNEYEAAGGAYNETLARNDFINPLLEALGWDVGNEAGLPLSRREVRVEETVELPDENDVEAAVAAGSPDYTIQPNGQRYYFVEAKKPSVRIDVARAPAYQIRRYGWSAGLSVSVLTNFAQLAVYDCRTSPEPGDEPAVARLPNHYFTYDEYDARFDELWASLSKEAVLDGTFEEVFDIEREVRGEASFDDVFLDQIRGWRRRIAADIAMRNRDMTARAVGRATQRLLNRLVFLRVCEDRNLEVYGQLLAIDDDEALLARFRDADRVYNAGLFRQLDEVDVDPALVHELITELYYPLSPYAFSVVEGPVLASIYEQFLGERVELDENRAVHFVRKADVVHAAAVVPTPPFIVNAILKRTLTPLLAARSADEIGNTTVADIACGSGAFLLGAFQVFLDAYESKGEGATLAMKHTILKNNIYGIDIDAEAVEVARFNLLLAVVENQTREEIEAFGQPALPDIDAQIISGNSLITPEFFDAFPEVRNDPDELVRVNPLDCDAAFPGVMERGGFDVIVGNPPYVRIQALAEFEPLQVAYFQNHSKYESAKAFNFDKYLLFLERTLELLAPNGRFGYIIPHRFMSLLAGQPIRKRLAEGHHVQQIVHFGHQQVFPQTQTYTCLLIGGQKPSESFTVELVSSLSDWREGAGPGPRILGSETISDGPWSFAPDEAQAIFERLRAEHKTTLSGIADIFVGVQTSADDIYLLAPSAVEEEELEVTRHGRTWRIERGVCRPAIRDRTLQPYGGCPEPDAWAIFPYRVEGYKGGLRAVVIPPEEMRAVYPEAWDYLVAHKDKLDMPPRNVSPYTEDTWYRYGRSQSLTKLDAPKIIVRVLSLAPQYNWDPDGLVVPGGGDGGPYYLIRPVTDSPVSIFFLIALLSHPVIDAMVWSAGGREYRGGYFPHRKAFLQDLPVPTHDPDAAAHISDLTETLVSTTMQVQRESDSDARMVLERDRAAQIARVEAEVSTILGLDSTDLEAVVGG